jgi:colicin import membrane protein
VSSVPRKLKTYQTSLGFYDLAVAAPSMKAALEAWGAASNLFHQGAAKETDDPEVVAATMAKAGVVLKRSAGSRGPFTEHAELPDLDDGASDPEKPRRPEPKRRTAPRISVEDSRRAAEKFEREQKRRDAERRKQEASRGKERAKREKRVAKAQAALEAAQRKHEERSGTLDAERRDLHKRIEVEDTRWDSEREKLKDALRRARE